MYEVVDSQGHTTETTISGARRVAKRKAKSTRRPVEVTAENGDLLEVAYPDGSLLEIKGKQRRWREAATTYEVADASSGEAFYPPEVSLAAAKKLAKAHTARTGRSTEIVGSDRNGTGTVGMYVRHGSRTVWERYA